MELKNGRCFGGNDKGGYRAARAAKKAQIRSEYFL